LREWLIKLGDFCCCAVPGWLARLAQTWHSAGFSLKLAKEALFNDKLPQK